MYVLFAGGPCAGSRTPQLSKPACRRTAAGAKPERECTPCTCITRAHDVHANSVYGVHVHEGLRGRENGGHRSPPLLPPRLALRAPTVCPRGAARRAPWEPWLAPVAAKHRTAVMTPAVRADSSAPLPHCRATHITDAVCFWQFFFLRRCLAPFNGRDGHLRSMLFPLSEAGTRPFAAIPAPSPSALALPSSVDASASAADLSPASLTARAARRGAASRRCLYTYSLPVCPSTASRRVGSPCNPSLPSIRSRTHSHAH
jgi:hypothetical protein